MYSSFPARVTFSFLNTDVSKSNEAGAFTTAAGANTIFAAIAPPELEPPAETAVLALRGLSDGAEERNPRLEAREGLRDLEEDAEEEEAQACDTMKI